MIDVSYDLHVIIHLRYTYVWQLGDLHKFITVNVVCNTCISVADNC